MTTIKMLCREMRVIGDMRMPTSSGTDQRWRVVSLLCGCGLAPSSSGTLSSPPCSPAMSMCQSYMVRLESARLADSRIDTEAHSGAGSGQLAWAGALCPMHMPYALCTCPAQFMALLHSHTATAAADDCSN